MHALLYRLGGSCSNREDIGRMGRGPHDEAIRQVTIVARVQTLVQSAANNLFVAEKSQDIARPVFRVDTGCANAQQVLNNGFVSLVHLLGRGISREVLTVPLANVAATSRST